jgi:hypothetical protein
MTPDISKMDPVVCPDCGQQLFIMPVKGVPNRFEFGGCRCKRDIYVVPDSIAAGVEGTPMFLYTERKKT